MSGCSSPTPAQKDRKPALVPVATSRGRVSGPPPNAVAALCTVPRRAGLPTIQTPRSSGGGRTGAGGGDSEAVWRGLSTPGNWQPASRTVAAHTEVRNSLLIILLLIARPSEPVVGRSCFPLSTG